MPTVRRDAFQGIADPTRREILNMIINEPMNLNHIAEKFDVSRPAISQHIKILNECGLLTITQKGRQRICEPNLEPLNEVAEWVEPFKELWEERFQQLDQLLDRMKSKNKNDQ